MLPLFLYLCILIPNMCINMCTIDHANNIHCIRRDIFNSLAIRLSGIEALRILEAVQVRSLV